MSVFENLVNSARDFACGLYKNQPGALIPNAGESVLRFAWDNLCDYPDNPSGLPPRPAPPFTGGQCCNLSYKVRWRATNDGGQSYFEGTSFSAYQGKILGFTRKYFNQGGSNASFGDYLQWQKCDGRILEESYTSGGMNDAANVSIQVLSVFTANGEADNCGNPPDSYPPAQPPPPDGYISPPTPIPLVDGDEIIVNFNFFPPAAPLDKIPPIVINYIQPEFDVNLKVPIEFNFNGEINIGAPSNPPANLPPDVINNINNTNNNTEQINNNFNDYRKDYDYFFNPPKLDNDPETIKEDDFIEDGKEEDKEGVIGLRIKLTKLPDKAQFGSPTVYFAGWMAFKRDEGYMPREQINFEDSFFLAPPGATGYTVTFTNGAQGNIRVYSKVEEV